MSNPLKQPKFSWSLLSRCLIFLANFGPPLLISKHQIWFRLRCYEENTLFQVIVVVKSLVQLALKIFLRSLTKGNQKNIEINVRGARIKILQGFSLLNKFQIVAYQIEFKGLSCLFFPKIQPLVKIVAYKRCL